MPQALISISFFRTKYGGTRNGRALFGLGYEVYISGMTPVLIADY